MVQIAPPTGHDWTNEEREELNRIGVACFDVVHWQLEFGRTDEGDPWMDVYDCKRDRVVVHLARIDRRYIVAVPAEQRFTWTVTVREAINDALTEIGALSIITV